MHNTKSQVFLNAQKDAAYCPYCISCRTMDRMKKVEHMLWKCTKCPAIHDERPNQAANDIKRPI